MVRNRDFSVRKQLLIRIRNKGNTERPTYYMVVVNSITVSVRCVACLLSYKENIFNLLIPWKMLI